MISSRSIDAMHSSYAMRGERVNRFANVASDAILHRMHDFIHATFRISLTSARTSDSIAMVINMCITYAQVVINMCITMLTLNLNSQSPPKSQGCARMMVCGVCYDANISRMRLSARHAATTRSAAIAIHAAILYLFIIAKSRCHRL